MRRISGAVVGGLLLSVLIGCNAGPFGGRVTLYDTNGDQPLGPDGRRVTMKGNVSWNFVKIYETMEWVSGEVRYDAFDLTWKADRYADRPGLVCEVGSSYFTYPDTRTIVCVDPIVVIVTQHETRGRVSQENGKIKPGVTSPWFKWATARIVLPRGYRYGTKFRADGEAQWYSPTLKVGLTPLPLTSNETTIDISSKFNPRWLTITRTGNWWRVEEGDPG